MGRHLGLGRIVPQGTHEELAQFRIAAGYRPSRPPGRGLPAVRRSVAGRRAEREAERLEAGSRNSISNVRSTIGAGWRIS